LITGKTMVRLSAVLYVVMGNLARGRLFVRLISVAESITKPEKRDARETVTLLERMASSPTSNMCATLKSNTPGACACAVRMCTLGGRVVLNPVAEALKDFVHERGVLGVGANTTRSRGRKSKSEAIWRRVAPAVASESIERRCMARMMSPSPGPSPETPVSFKGSPTPRSSSCCNRRCTCVKVSSCVLLFHWQ
jgi:hypothetical protein